MDTLLSDSITPEPGKPNLYRYDLVSYPFRKSQLKNQFIRFNVTFANLAVETPSPSVGISLLWCNLAGTSDTVCLDKDKLASVTIYNRFQPDADGSVKITYSFSFSYLTPENELSRHHEATWINKVSLQIVIPNGERVLVRDDDRFRLYVLKESEIQAIDSKYFRDNLAAGRNIIPSRNQLLDYAAMLGTAVIAGAIVGYIFKRIYIDPPSQ